jgi:hypothetical protein
VIVWIAALFLALALVVALLALFLSRRSQLGYERSVILHLPEERAWEAVRDFPSLHAAHARCRQHLVIRETSLRHGKGPGAGSVWRQSGSWSGGRYWADLEVTEYDPPRRLSVRLLRDSLGTHRGVLRHHGILTLVSEGPAATKLTWRLSARIVGARLAVLGFLTPDRLRARLLDLSLRSVKRALDGHARREDRPGGALPLHDEIPCKEPGAHGRGAAPGAPLRPPAGGPRDQP